MKQNMLMKLSLVTGMALMTSMAWADDPMTSQTAMPNNNQPANSDNNNMASQMPLSPQKFVTDAATCGMKEVYVSQLALQKSQNDDVKSFANRMIRDHSAANRKLEKIAMEEGYSFPSTNLFTANDPNWNNTQLNHLPTDTIKGQAAEALIATNGQNLADYQAVQSLQTVSGTQFDRAYA